MRKAADAIVRSRFRSPAVSTLSEALACASVAATAAPSTSGRAPGLAYLGATPHAVAAAQDIPRVSPDPACPPRRPQNPSGPNGTSASSAHATTESAAGGSRLHPQNLRLATGASAESWPWVAHSPHRTVFARGHVRGFAASAAGARRGGAPGGSGSDQEAVSESVPADQAARMVLEDPMSRLMASQGMPVGLSLRSTSDRAGAEASSSSSSGSSRRPATAEEEAEDLTKPPPAEPAYQMEAFSDMLRATAAAARHGGVEAGVGAGGSGADVGGGGGGGGGGSFTAGVQRVGPSLDDSWGTTRESPADIARRIVESNLDAERGGGLEAQRGSDSDDGDDGPDLPMALSPSEEKYASLEAMSAEIKKLDEVFEVLASVPWLDEDNLAEKELKGVAQVGLLGTLEEVGFNIRHQLLRIWSGERGADLAAGPRLEFRDQAALLAILYHTQQIEDKYGAPPRGYMAKPPPSADPQ